jgi:hypothetical protein
VPSEFGCDVEHADHTLEPAKRTIESKIQVRQVIRAAGIPHTIICSNWAIGLLLCGLVHSQNNGPLSTGLHMFGDEKTRGNHRFDCLD